MTFYIETRYAWVMEEEMIIDYDENRNVLRLKSAAMMLNPTLGIVHN
ncbi:iron-sulfur cluster biosynthesis family protein [Salisediminibacterium beveridgei]|nr:iron-sulfur cluster biosynthesis family protein [Salisediminibacterium beveridgei]